MDEGGKSMNREGAKEILLIDNSLLPGEFDNPMADLREMIERAHLSPIYPNNEQIEIFSTPSRITKDSFYFKLWSREAIRLSRALGATRKTLQAMWPQYTKAQIRKIIRRVPRGPHPRRAIPEKAWMIMDEEAAL
jgi:hypothetical protein